MTVEPAVPTANEPMLPRPGRISWPRAALLTVCAVYGPQLIMCLYTLGFVSCSHCKLAVWQVAPVAPGLFLGECGQRIFNLPHFSSELGIAFAIALSLLVLVGLTAWLRHAGRWRLAILILVALASAMLAFALLSAIRS